MRIASIITAFALVTLISAGVDAAETSKAKTLIDSAKVNIDAFAAKAGDSKAVADDLAQARTNLKKAEEIFAKGRQMFGLGDVKPEAEQDIKHYTAMAELSVSIAQTRLEAVRAETEAESLAKLLSAAKTKIKRYDDRKAEFEKLKGDAAKVQGIMKELEAIKADKAMLTTQMELLKSENAKLVEQMEKLRADRKKADSPLDDGKKIEIKREPAAVIPATKELPATKDTPALK